jgi:uncharacterized protein YprB with RNaseH-like and TPR domain
VDGLLRGGGWRWRWRLSASPAISAAPQRTRRLFFDIETSLADAVVWGTGKQYVGPENITKEPAIICVAWKWEGKGGTRCLAWDDQHDDRALLAEFVEIMHSADEIVTHNGDHFDTPWIRTRCLKHGLPMSPEFVSIDTLKSSRSRFRFPYGNRLDSIARFLELGRKKPTGVLDLWKAVGAGDANALRKMVAYCRHDVDLLASTWGMMMPYLPAKANRAEGASQCPECASRNVSIQKHRVTAAGYRKTQFQCGDCGKYHSVATSRFEKARGAVHA